MQSAPPTTNYSLLTTNYYPLTTYTCTREHDEQGKSISMHPKSSPSSSTINYEPRTTGHQLLSTGSSSLLAIPSVLCRREGAAPPVGGTTPIISAGCTVRCRSVRSGILSCSNGSGGEYRQDAGRIPARDSAGPASMAASGAGGADFPSTSITGNYVSR